MSAEYERFNYPWQVTAFLEKLKIEAAKVGKDPQIIGITTGETGPYVVFYWKP